MVLAALEALKTISHTGDADHDAFFFFSVSRPPKTEGALQELLLGGERDITVRTGIEGCPCSITRGMVSVMESDKEVKLAIIKAVGIILAREKKESKHENN